MKNALLLLAGATAFSLASCSSNSTTETTTAPAGTGTTTTTTTTKTVSDEAYHSRANRMADKYATDMKISDEATREKLRTAYYNRSKRYDDMMGKYQSDTTGMGTARRQYNMDTDNEFKTVLSAPDQYSSYQSSRSTYDEANNLGVDDQSATGANAATPSDNSSMSTPATDNTAASGTTTDNTASGTMSSGAGVVKGKTKLDDGTKIKVKDDGTVKVKDADGNKAKM